MSGRTGGNPPAREPGGGTTGRATHRGVEWRRDPDGTLGWYNDGLGGWVRWRPDGDNPPLPPGWEAHADAVPGRAQRPRLLTPWRLVPLGIAAAVVVVGAIQAIGATGHPFARATAQARALQGRCLAVSPASGRSPSYLPAPVPCTSPSASVRVVALVDLGGGAPGACPAGAAALQLSYFGVRPPILECVRPVARG